MTEKLKWQKLFSIKRIGDSTEGTSSIRSAFERDFDRVVFSSAFRRLQDKTQVIPLPENDFVHSRLTHSLEVSCVGRSLGRIVGEKIIDKYGLDLYPSDFGAVVAAACLAHDIGNPPFGHSGESAISVYFKHGKGKKFEEIIGDKKKWSDLINFEGNANGFRILTNSDGIRLTYTTMAAFTKYPCFSSKEKDKTIKRASQKKYGYFHSDSAIVSDIFQTLEITSLSNGVWLRHPLAFLVEAADDICYRIIDFEDGVRIGLIPFKQAESILLSLIPEQKLNRARYDRINDESEQIGYLRALTINELIYKASEIFLLNEVAILNGSFDASLIDHFDCIKILEEIDTISREKIYDSKSVLQIEIAGFNVVAELLDSFIQSVNDLYEYGDDTRKEKPISFKLKKLLPKQYLGTDSKPEDDLYLRILQICEFVAGMTDTYAINLYKRLKGIELPHE